MTFDGATCTVSVVMKIVTSTCSVNESMSRLFDEKMIRHGTWNTWAIELIELGSAPGRGRLRVRAGVMMEDLG